MLKLPVKGEDFEDIRKNNLLYVDKTKHLYNIASETGCYFLSRPRRFGKSLLIGALVKLLEGRRDLFKGLWIDSSDYDFKKRPVISLSMTGSCDTKDRLLGSIKSKLMTAAEDNDLTLSDLGVSPDASPDVILSRLIATLYRRDKSRVAVLIDEYDAPIQGVINNLAQAEINQGVLRDFYSALKTMADQSRTSLIFVTGITKFAQTSVFSVFDNYFDMTLKPEYNAICGFTFDEFERYFSEYLPDFLAHNQSEGFMPAEADLDYLKKEIIGFYDGYSWDGKTRVINPFSLINALSDKLIDSYWFHTATPYYLVNFLKRENFDLYIPENPRMKMAAFRAVDIKNLQLIPLLFQSGYLTVDKRLNPKEFLLKRPNQEVNEALDETLFSYLLGLEDDDIIDELKKRIFNALNNFDSAALAEAFHDILLLNSFQELKASEGQCQALIFLVLKTMHFKILGHQTTPRGEHDILICLGNRVAFVCEAKYEPYTPVRGQDEKNDASLKVKLTAALKAAKVQMSLRKYEE
jgi:hypothetical protein